MGPKDPILLTKPPILTPYNSPIVALIDPFKRKPILIIKAPMLPTVGNQSREERLRPCSGPENLGPRQKASGGNLCI